MVRGFSVIQAKIVLGNVGLLGLTFLEAMFVVSMILVEDLDVSVAAGSLVLMLHTPGIIIKSCS